jgi:hypothetical protein
MALVHRRRKISDRYKRKGETARRRRAVSEKLDYDVTFEPE